MRWKRPLPLSGFPDRFDWRASKPTSAKRATVSKTRYRSVCGGISNLRGKRHKGKATEICHLPHVPTLLCYTFGDCLSASFRLRRLLLVTVPGPARLPCRNDGESSFRALPGHKSERCAFGYVFYLLALRARTDTGWALIQAPVPRSFCFSDTLKICHARRPVGEWWNFHSRGDGSSPNDGRIASRRFSASPDQFLAGAGCMNENAPRISPTSKPRAWSSGYNSSSFATTSGMSCLPWHRMHTSWVGIAFM
uniref:Uncharacterized protein n=1 Tax=Candidatus Kentrum sp. LFY TaxID=2126342 RepID=A0A450UTM6_9GAMM|nr:MAG: hypothetical protein BECKLFY1418A_GA0070994_105319 [Candidatus Kentron sp. LFY]